MYIGILKKIGILLNILWMLHKMVSFLYKQDASLVSEYIINYQAIR